MGSGRVDWCFPPIWAASIIAMKAEGAPSVVNICDVSVAKRQGAFQWSICPKWSSKEQIESSSVDW